MQNRRPSSLNFFPLYLYSLLIMHTPVVTSFVALVLAMGALGSYEGLSTFYEGVMGPISACGVPKSKIEDLPFVALNEGTAYSGGSNCGRWVKITLGNNCAGGSNSASSVCNGGCALPCICISLPCICISHPSGTCTKDMLMHVKATTV
jgi:hypothetical protein